MTEVGGRGEGVFDPLSEGEVGLHGCVVSLTGALRGGVIEWGLSLDYRSPAPFIDDYFVYVLFLEAKKDTRIFCVIEV